VNAGSTSYTSIGGAASTTQRARIQIDAMRDAFLWLGYDLVERIGVTISFGTVERALDPLTELFEANVLLAHRMFVLLRGAPQRLRSRYRLRAFADMLRGLGRVAALRPARQHGTELTWCSRFAKVLKPMPLVRRGRFVAQIRH
jgi:hypothetical protein